MIDEVDRRLEEWVAAVIQDTEVLLTIPGDAEGKRAVGVYLLDLLPAPPVRTERRLPLQLFLRYLITTAADAPEEAHRMLGSLVFAAMEHPDFAVELEPLPAEFWRAFATKPQPSFLLRVPLRFERPEPKVARVRRPIEVRHCPVANLAGQVLGPDEVPLPNVLVELPTLKRSARTDARGRFRFEAVPGDPKITRLRVEAKGREFWIDATPGTGDLQPLMIHLEPMEV